MYNNLLTKKQEKENETDERVQVLAIFDGTHQGHWEKPCPLRAKNALVGNEIPLSPEANTRALNKSIAIPYSVY